MSRRLTCPECGRFFGFEDLHSGEVRLRCSNCKNWTIIKASPHVELTNDVTPAHNDVDDTKKS